jgi:hypothetical protein
MPQFDVDRPRVGSRNYPSMAISYALRRLSAWGARPGSAGQVIGNVFDDLIACPVRVDVPAVASDWAGVGQESGGICASVGIVPWVLVEFRPYQSGTILVTSLNATGYQRVTLGPTTSLSPDESTSHRLPARRPKTPGTASATTSSAKTGHETYRRATVDRSRG